MAGVIVAFDVFRTKVLSRKMFKLMPACVILLFSIASLPSTNAAYNVVSFGAKPDGQSDSTLPFLRAWMAACNSVAPAMVYVPRGTFLIKNAVFSGPCKNRILFQIQGTLVAPWDYRSLGNSGFWILFQKVSWLTVSGGGTVDGRGAGFWACRRTGSNCPYGTRSITFLWCNDIVVSGLTSINSQLCHFAVARCNNLRIQNVRIIAPSNSPNTDGIIVQDSTGVTIFRSIIRTGDDCIAIGPNTKNVWIERIGCGPGHGISIGSLGNGLNENGVQNVTVTNSVFTKTDNGVRIKSWARASNSYATNINFRNLIMRNVANPILIDQTYCPNNQCPHQSSGVKISQVTYKNIRGTSKTEAAVIFDCSSSNPCRGIRLQDIKLSTAYRATTATCNNAGGYSSGIVIPGSCLGR
ncbi:hypothetical protein RJ639_008518 [Escallonia herrerae]|uniref:Polygalacturonase n=1 Tax=Escallonia herrerae TaxID=1293975 RepID=A0AA89AQ04_9ASTE|nr:hypothetical protein RJ639_008518 [Escallonia herrerae]